MIDKRHPGDVGIDLVFPSDISIGPNEVSFKIDLMVAVQCLDVTAIKNRFVDQPFFVVPRSSIVKTALRLSNSIGIIDAGYRGNIMAFVDNLSNQRINLKAGTSLFQIVSFSEPIEKIEIVTSLPDSQRGKGGFGSTGDTIDEALGQKRLDLTGK